MSEEWFLLQFKANAHYIAVKNLGQQGFETFLPTNTNDARKASRFVNAAQPLFPGYMFVKFDKEKTKWNKINNTYGVLRLVAFNSVIKSIPDTIINNLMARCDSSGKLLPMKQLKTGDQVKITMGPFANFVATVETYETDQRIWVLMDILGRKTKIQASTNNLHL